MLATWRVGFVHPLGYTLSEQRISAFLADSLVVELVFSRGFIRHILRHVYVMY